MLTYRKEIDGLRALAVLPVILFHAGFETFSGGFVGVDVFFVISGYLITSLIVQECAQGNFSIVNFYERRARRILPALFLVMFATIPLAWLYLLPHELVDFGESLIATSVFSSNILFWQDSNYFAAEAGFIPLLHTWSLAVEEQFYVLFPLLVMAVWAIRKGWLSIVIAIIALASLALSEWLWRVDIPANFYLLPSRAWELMIGSLVALYLRDHQIHSVTLRQIGSLAGLIMLLSSVFLFDKNIPFPSLYALLPTVGTALLILCATPDTFTGKLLTLPVFVGIGLISYSAYLWHQPLFAFARIISEETPWWLEETPWWLFAGLSLLSLGLAWLSWRFVEQPFRRKPGHTKKSERIGFSRGQIFTGALLGSLLIIAIGVGFMLSKGAPDRFSLKDDNHNDKQQSLTVMATHTHLPAGIQRTA